MSDIFVRPRQTPSRDDRYMGLAIAHSAFSKDPNTQIGAYIVAPDNTPRSAGYNGPSKKINDNKFNWARGAGKNDLIDHAEENAIEYSNGPLENCTIYVTGHPCKNCMRLIVRKGISRVVYLHREYDPGSSQFNVNDYNRSMEIAEMGGVKVEKYQGSVSWLPDWIDHLKQQGILPI